MRRTRGQAGFTLIEILIAMGIAVLLIGPVGAWMILVMDTEGPTAQRFTDASQARIANTYLSRDVASSELVRPNPTTPNPSCGPSTGGDTVLLQLVQDAEEPVRVSYVLHTDDGVTSLWRRRCLVSDTTVITAQSEILRGVAAVPAASAACNPTGDADCRQVTLSAQLESGKQINVRAMRRATLDPQKVGTGGNFRPFAKITDVSRSGVRPDYTVVLDSDRSGDIDGTIANRTWSVSGPGAVTQTANGSQGTFVFAAVGRYTVTLAVTDGTDSSEVSTQIDVSNQAPTVAATVNPAAGAVAGPAPATFAFDASTSGDIDGDVPLTYNWDFGDGVDPASPSLGGATPSVRFLATASLGPREVKVTVTDFLGDSTVGRVAINVLPPSGVDPGPGLPGTITVTTNGEPGGQLVNTPGKSARAGTVGVGRPAVTVTFATPGPGTVRWELRRGATVAASSTALSWSRSFNTGDSGDWTIALIPDGSPETTTAFRLNGAPTAAFSSPTGGGSAPLAVAFSSSASTDDGSITRWAWNFGWFDQWTSNLANPTQLFTHSGSYTVWLTVEDDDGATAGTAATVTIGGTPATPAPGSFSGDTYSWAPIPGAANYEAFLQVTGGGSCAAAVTASVTPSMSPSVVAGHAGCTVTASYRVRSGDVWSGWSTVTVRP